MEPSILEAGGRIGASSLTIHHYGFLRTDRFKNSFYGRLARRQAEAEPTRPQSWIDFGTTFTGRTNLPFALEAFRQARRLGERATSAFFIGSVLSQMGHPAPAARYLREALRYSRRDASWRFDNADALEELAAVHETLGRSGEAESAYRKALESRPESPAAANNLAAMLVERRAWAQAQVLLDRLMARCPGLDEPWTTLGLLRLGRGSLEGARRAFETALEINSENLPALINLALTHRAAGRPRLAARAYGAAWELGDGREPHEMPLPSCLPPPPARHPVRRLRKGGVVSIISQLYGGAGRVLADIVSSVRNRPHVVLCTNAGTYTRQGLRAELESLGAQVRTIRTGPGLLAILADLRPDYVIHHWSDQIISEPRRVGDECWIAVGHGARALPNGYDRYVVLSEFHRLFQTHLPPEQVRFIPNGVKLSRFRRPDPRPRRPVTIAMLSRLDVCKFPRRLLAFVPPLRQLGARLLIAGRGGLRYEIEPELARTPLAARVRFVGGLHGTRVPEFLCAADIGLHLTETHQEICSVAILEMLAAGLPIVAEPKGCLPELIADGRNGFLADTEDRIAARLTTLIQDVDLRRRMGRASREMARQYSMTRFTASWRDLLADAARPVRATPGNSEPAGSTLGDIRHPASPRPGAPDRARPAEGPSVSEWRPRLSFLVCATPRSGSSLLCEALWNTGVAGRPQEFFNVEVERRAMRDSSRDEFADYMATVLDNGSSPNGVFGAKIFESDLAPLLGRLEELFGAGPQPSALLEKAFRGLHLIRIVRRDKLRQAVSLYRAMHSGRLVSDGNAAPKAQFDRHEIERCRRELDAQDEAWRAFCDANAFQPLTVCYEDLERDYEGTARTVLKYLGISPPRPMHFGERRLQRQSDAISERWIRRLQRVPS